MAAVVVKEPESDEVYEDTEITEEWTPAVNETEGAADVYRNDTMQ